MKVLLITPSQKPNVIEIDGTLVSMQNLVQGQLEIIYPFEDSVAIVCNENGKMYGFQLNRVLRHPKTNEIYDVIVGDFFICGLNDEGLTSLNQDQIRRYTDLFYYPEFLPFLII